MKKVKSAAEQAAVLMVLLLLISFADGKSQAKGNPKPSAAVDSTEYYRINTLLNWDLMQTRIKTEK